MTIRSVFLLLSVALSLPGRAQVSQVQQPPRPARLSAMLSASSWDASTRGVLLVVGAETTVLLAPPPPAPPQGYPLRETAAIFRQTLVPFGGVTVMAPMTMQRLAKPTLSPEESLGSTTDGMLMRLLGLLNKKQWKQLGSPEGFGRGDCTDMAQRAAFDALLQPMRITPVLGQKLVKQPDGTLLQEPISVPPTLLPWRGDREDHSTIRLRLQLRNTILGEREGGYPGERRSLGEPVEVPPHYEIAFVGGRNQPGVIDERNRLKPSQLDEAALAGTISLEGLTTVKVLLARISEVTHLELHADPRYADLSLRWWGERARIRDILPALRLALMGAFRKVGPAYVLTHDIVPLGILQRPYILGQIEEGKQEQKRTEQLIQQIQTLGGVALFGVAEGDFQGLTPEQERKAHRGNEAPLAVSTLPPALQQQVRTRLRQIGEHPDHLGNPVSVHLDRFWLEKGFQLEVLAPQRGAVRWNTSLTPLWAERLMPPPPQELTAPAVTWTFRERAAWVQPTSPAEAKELAVAAKEAGLTALWVVVPLEPQRAEELLKAAQLPGLALFAVIRPFQLPKMAMPAGAVPDLSVTLDTSDQVTAFSPPMPPIVFSPRYRTEEQLVQIGPSVNARVVALAKLPQLDGLVLEGLVPDGYRAESWAGRSGLWHDYGYTLGNRLTYLRQAHTDPLDLFPVPTPMPMWNYIRGEYIFGWNQLRAKRHQQGLVQLYQALQAGAPQRALRVPDIEGGTSWVGSWDTPATPPVLGMGLREGPDAAHQKAKTAIVMLSIFPDTSPVALRLLIHAVQQDQPRWDGAVLPLQNMAFPQALLLLRGLKTP